MQSLGELRPELIKIQHVVISQFFSHLLKYVRWFHFFLQYREKSEYPSCMGELRVHPYILLLMKLELATWTELVKHENFLIHLSNRQNVVIKESFKIEDISLQNTQKSSHRQHRGLSVTPTTRKVAQNILERRAAAMESFVTFSKKDDWHRPLRYLSRSHWISPECSGADCEIFRWDWVPSSCYVAFQLVSNCRRCVVPWVK